jgi:hypothetical protein
VFLTVTWQHLVLRTPQSILPAVCAAGCFVFLFEVEQAFSRTFGWKQKWVFEVNFRVTHLDCECPELFANGTYSDKHLTSLSKVLCIALPPRSCGVYKHMHAGMG